MPEAGVSATAERVLRVTGASVLVEVCCGCGSVVDSELGVDVVEVFMDRAGCDPEGVGDLPVSHPFGDVEQHFRLTFAEQVMGHLLHGCAGATACLYAAAQLEQMRLKQVEQRSLALAEVGLSAEGKIESARLPFGCRDSDRH
jgi:hypothetical protein